MRSRITVLIFIPIMVLGLLFSFLVLSEPAMAAGWSQEAAGGIDGNYDNAAIGVSCMADFGGNLYVGASDFTNGCSIWHYDGTTWTQSVGREPTQTPTIGPGFGSSNNSVAASMAVFGTNLYVGTNNTASGCEIWRTPDGINWTRVDGNTLGGANTEISSMEVFGTNLYVGTDNTTSGCEIWRSPNGTTWNRVDGGLLGGNNVGAASLAVFGSNLYVGTDNSTSGCEIWRSPNGTAWGRVDGGLLGGNNTVVSCMAIFGANIYVGTDNTTSGCEIWRSPNGLAWTRVDGGALGAANTKADCMAILGANLHVGTRNNAGCEIWRSPNGTTWNAADGSGFGNMFNNEAFSMQLFGGSLYVGTVNGPYGCQVWRTAGAGGPPYTDWTQVNISSFAPNANYAVSLTPYKGNLYAGTMSESGFELWRFDGTTWTAINQDGFGNNNNAGGSPLAVLGDDLYLGTANLVEGCEIWRSPNGIDWTQVVGQAAGTGAGFGNPDNWIANSAAVFGGFLYVGTYNPNSGCEIWRSPDGTAWSNVAALGAANIRATRLVVFGGNLYAGTQNGASGCEIWRSPDGTTWTRVDGGALGGANTRADTMTVFGENLYVGTNTWAGCEIWRSPDGTTWTRVDGGALGAANAVADSMIVHDSRLWVGTTNWTTGCEVWSTAGEGGPPFTDWTLENTGGFGDANNGSASSMASYFSGLHVGTFNFTDGCEVWNTGSQWYLAEGYTGGEFDEWVLIQNPGADPAMVTLDFQVQGGTAPPFGPFVLNGGERQSIHLDTLTDLSDAQVSTKVTSDELVVAERALYFTYDGKPGGHDSIGVTSPSDTWYLAEGYTGGDFDTWVLVQNPGADPATVTLDFQVQGGTAPPFGPFVLNGGERFSVHLDVLDNLSDAQVSTRVTSDELVVAERALYFTYDGKPGGHDSKGVNSPARTWYLAEGYTGGEFDTWVLIQNPGTTDAQVTLDFQVQGATAPPFGPFILGAGQRFSVHLDDLDSLADAQVSTKVTSNMPVVAERAVYFTYDGKSGGHDSVGATSTSNTWYLAEGYTGGDFDTWVLVQNPGTAVAQVTLDFQLLGGAAVAPFIFNLNGGERYSVHLDDIPGLEDAQVSTKVVSDMPVVAERAMYFTYDGKQGGHDSVGYSP